MRALPLLPLLFLPYAVAFKFLAYSPRFASSHVNFIAKLADSLVERGHEVVILSPIMDRSVKMVSTNASIISLPICSNCDRFERIMNDVLVSKLWTYKNMFDLFEGMEESLNAWTNRCNETLHYPGLIERLRNEKFDVAFGESANSCFVGLVHLLGIEKYALTDSVAINDLSYSFSHTPTNLAYVPGFMGGSEVMSFTQRFSNVLMYTMAKLTRQWSLKPFRQLFQVFDENFPDIEELSALNSLYFVNSEPLLDFPKITSARVIDIGGIVVSNGAKSLNETWSSILDLRPRSILISFGSFAKSHLMPELYKKNIREVIKKFPDVTFIWKYEKPEHKISEGVDNLIETTWMPQNDLINDPRLSAFITHCGQGSTSEASYAGIPLLVIPIAIDQLRNAEQIKRNGLGVALNRDDLVTAEPLEKAIKEILDNPVYSEKAKSVRKMLLERPFTMKEIFVRNMEFLALHGPLRQLDHYGRHLSFAQYYLLDIITVSLFVVLSIIVILFFVSRRIFRAVFSLVKQKAD
ncbi:hypothetical protein PMAYCL1PPCAC_10688 [Pristionchus mayeri]|uniref:glucuronosyltransferase n=1 Tax=Pristionchus mayeri TaxID=1317129 RepID=A0AAN4ZFZ5_9BILA|nr:hypothetical protein PMAYCL1PPCAC_10688 [Pristionchus mayeri]